MLFLKAYQELSYTYSTCGEGEDSTRPEIVLFITSIRDATEPQKLVTCPKILLVNTIFNIKMTNSYPESRDMTIFGNIPYQKAVKYYLYCNNF